MNQLILGDIFNKIKEIPDKSIDLIITDPPYKIVAGGGWLMLLSRKGKVSSRSLKERYAKLWYR